MTEHEAQLATVDDQRLLTRAALIVFGVVLLGYVATLAPTVTFWDAGELIAAMNILGIPHPPGTPLFVLIGKAWGTIFPFGEFAFRTNLMTAIFSAAAAAFMFLVVAHALRGWSAREGEAISDALTSDKLFVIGGAAGAAVMAAFAFTVWQNSIETEVYMVATLSIAAICLLSLGWRKHRGDERAPHILLLIVYLLAVSIGNHLLTLLVGPAIFGFMWHVMRTNPLPERASRRVEWGQWMVMVGIWLMLTGIGLGLNAMLLGLTTFLGVWVAFLVLNPRSDTMGQSLAWGQLGVVAVPVVLAWAMVRFDIPISVDLVQLSIYAIMVFALLVVVALGVGRLSMPSAVFAIALVGASTYAFLYIRANVGPLINEADPSTLENLFSVIWREQYPPRSPIDNPIYTMRDGTFIDRLGAFVSCLPRFVDGPVPEAQAAFGQVPECYTVRSIPLMFRQAHMYLQYFDWQWSKGLAPQEPVFAKIRLPLTIFVASLGVYGAAVLRERDRSAFWLLIMLFLTTGPGLAGYMNFKPGFSLGWITYPSMTMHEVRERDYFFTVSFQVWGLLAGIGLAGLYVMGIKPLLTWFGTFGALFRRDTERAVSLAQERAVVFDPKARRAPFVFVIALMPMVLNLNAASRKHGPDALLARDFAYNLLQSAEPYGIIFTNGDNDTFPLWYLQEVEGVRQDVSVVNLSLGNTDWYLRQLRDNPVREFDAEASPWYSDLAPDEPPPPLHSLSDVEISELRSQLLQRDYHIKHGLVDITLEANSPLYVKDVLVLRLLQENWDKRPMYFGLTAGPDNWQRMQRYLTQEGLLFKVHTKEPPDDSKLGPGLFGVPMNVPRTDSLAWQVFRYADLFGVDSLKLEPTARNITTNLSYPFYSLGNAYELLGDPGRALENLRRGYHLQPIPEMLTLMRNIEDSLPIARGPPVVFGDTTIGVLGDTPIRQPD